MIALVVRLFTLPPAFMKTPVLFVPVIEPALMTVPAPPVIFTPLLPPVMIPLVRLFTLPPTPT